MFVRLARARTSPEAVSSSRISTSRAAVASEPWTTSAGESRRRRARGGHGEQRRPVPAVAVPADARPPRVPQCVLRQDRGRDRLVHDVRRHLRDGDDGRLPAVPRRSGRRGQRPSTGCAADPGRCRPPRRGSRRRRGGGGPVLARNPVQRSRRTSCRSSGRHRDRHPHTVRLDRDASSRPRPPRPAAAARRARCARRPACRAALSSSKPTPSSATTATSWSSVRASSMRTDSCLRVFDDA